MSGSALESDAQRAIIQPDKDTFLAEENPFEAMMERFDLGDQGQAHGRLLPLYGEQVRRRGQ